MRAMRQPARLGHLQSNGLAAARHLGIVGGFMSQDSAVSAAQQQFGVGKVLSTTFQIFGSNLVPFLAIGLVLQIPALILEQLFDPASMVNVASPGDTDWGYYFRYIGLALVVGGIVNGLLTATLIYGSFQYLRGQKATLGECLAKGISALVPVAIAALGYSILAALGWILLIIPGVMIMVTYWLYAPVIVVEKQSIGQAFSRSADLTRGKRWSIFGLSLIYWVVAYLASLIIGLIFGAAGGTSSPIAVTIFSYAVNALLAAFLAVATSVTYYYLRADKEGLDIDDIAKLFD